MSPLIIYVKNGTTGRDQTKRGIYVKNGTRPVRIGGNDSRLRDLGQWASQ